MNRKRISKIAYGALLLGSVSAIAGCDEIDGGLMFTNYTTDSVGLILNSLLCLNLAGFFFVSNFLKRKKNILENKYHLYSQFLFNSIVLIFALCQVFWSLDLIGSSFVFSPILNLTAAVLFSVMVFSTPRETRDVVFGNTTITFMSHLFFFCQTLAFWIFLERGDAVVLIIGGTIFEIGALMFLVVSLLFSFGRDSDFDAAIGKKRNKVIDLCHLFLAAFADIGMAIINIGKGRDILPSIFGVFLFSCAFFLLVMAFTRVFSKKGEETHAMSSDSEGHDDETESAENDNMGLEMKTKVAVEVSPTESIIRNNLTFTIDDVSFKMVFVKGGYFMTRDHYNDKHDDNNNPDALENESPVRQKYLSDYHIGETQVTQELWEKVMGENPSSIKRGDHPVETISECDCIAFTERLNRIFRNQLPTEYRFQLPTEAQWEFAARGGNRSVGYQYSGGDDIENVAWYQGNSGDTTHPVMEKEPNELGIYDMSGNVWEWCKDWYGQEEDEDRPFGYATFSVLRGGSGARLASACRVIERAGMIYDDCNKWTGFRLALVSIFALV